MAAFRWNFWFCLMLIIMIIFIRLGQSHPFYRRTMDANATTDDSFPEPQMTNGDRENAVSVQTECDPDSGRANITIVVFPGERFVTYTQVICHNNVFPVLMGFSNVYFPNSTMRDHQFLCLFDGPFHDPASASVIYNATVSLFWDDGKGSLFESNCLVSGDKLSMDVDSTTLLPDSTMKDSNTHMGVTTDNMDGQIGKDESSDITTKSFEDPVSKTTECKNRSSENMPPAFPEGAVIDQDIFTPSMDMNSLKIDQTTFRNEIVHTGSRSTPKPFDTFTSSAFPFENMASEETVPVEELDPSNQMDDVENQSPTSASPLDDLPKLQLPSSTISTSVAVHTTVSSIEAIHSPIPAEETSSSSSITSGTRQELDRAKIAKQSTMSGSKTLPPPVIYDKLTSTSIANMDSPIIPPKEIPNEYDKISSTEDVSFLSSEAMSSRLKYSETKPSTRPMSIISTVVMLPSSEDIMSSFSSSAAITSAESDAKLTGISLTRLTVPSVQLTATVSPSFHVPETMSTSIRTTGAMLVIAPELHSSTLSNVKMSPVKSSQSEVTSMNSIISVYPQTTSEKSTSPTKSSESAVRSTSTSDSEREATIMRVSSRSSKFNIELKNQSSINSSTTDALEDGTLSDTEHPNYSPADLSEVKVKTSSRSTASRLEAIHPTTSSSISQYELFEKTSESMINLMPSTKPMSEIKTFILETSSRPIEQNPTLSSSIESTNIHSKYPIHTLEELDSSTAAITQMKISHLTMTDSFSSTADINVETVTKTQGLLQSQMSNDVVLDNETLSNKIQKPLRTSLIKVSNKEDSQDNSTQNKMTSSTSTELNPIEENPRKYITSESSTAPFLSTESWEGHEEKSQKQMTSTERSQQSGTEEISLEIPQSISISATKGMTTVEFLSKVTSLKPAMLSDKPFERSTSRSVETSTYTQPDGSVFTTTPLETIDLPSVEAASKSKVTENTILTVKSTTDARPTEKSTYEMVEGKTTVAMHKIISTTDATPGGEQTTKEHQRRMIDPMQQGSISTPTSKPENNIQATSNDAKLEGKPSTVPTSQTLINPKRKVATTDETSKLSTKKILPQLELSSTANTTPKSLKSSMTPIIRSFFDERPFNERFLEKKSSNEISSPPSKQLLPKTSINSVSTAKPFNKALYTVSKDSLLKIKELTNSVPSSTLSTPSTNAMSTGEIDIVTADATGDDPLLDKSTKATYTVQVKAEDSIDEMKVTASEGETTDTAPRGQTTYTTKTDGTTHSAVEGETTGAMQEGESTTQALLEDVTTTKTTDAMTSGATLKLNASVLREEANASDKDSISYKTTSIKQSKTLLLAFSSTQASPRLEKSETETPTGVRSDNVRIHPDSTTTTTMQKTMKTEESTAESRTSLPTTDLPAVSQESTPSMVSSSPEAESATSTRKTSMKTMNEATNDKTEAPPLKVVQSKSNIFMNKQAK